jgi:hypothetical protein
LRGRPPAETPPAAGPEAATRTADRPSSALATVGVIVLALLAALLALEVVEENYDGLRHVVRRMF